MPQIIGKHIRLNAEQRKHRNLRAQVPDFMLKLINRHPGAGLLLGDEQERHGTERVPLSEVSDNPDVEVLRGTMLPDREHGATVVVGGLVEFNYPYSLHSPLKFALI